MDFKQHKTLTITMGLFVGLILSIFVELSNGNEVRAQDSPEALSTECVRAIPCNGDLTWGNENAIWQSIDIRPVERTGPRRNKIVWENAEGEFQPFKFTAFWRGATPSSTTQETVTIGADGDDTGATSHPNIRFHSAGVTLCDGGTTIDPLQRLGVHNDSVCIEAIEYSFDIRKFKNGSESNFWVDSQGWANSENAALDAVLAEVCGDSETPFTFVTQQPQNLHCRFSTYIVKYDDPP